MESMKKTIQDRHDRHMSEALQESNDKKISEKLSYILNEIRSLSQKLESPKDIQKTRSDDLKDLFSALAKAQSEMRSAGLNSENPYFKSKYAGLAEVVKASRSALTKNELSVIQQIMPNKEGQNFLHTILGHASGQWIESRMRIVPHKPDIQSLGSYITYLRRYSYASIIGVVSANEDDDGELAVHDMRKTVSKGVALNTKYNPRKQSSETITKEQLEELEYELGDYTDICEMVLEGLKIQSLADMPKDKYMVSVRRIREIKKLREGR